MSPGPLFVVGGESLIDLVSEARTAGEAMRFSAHPGGSSYNCAIALGRLKQRVGYLCPISTDAFGDRLLSALTGAGVRVLIGERVGAPTTLALVTFDAAGEAHYRFHRGAERALSLAAGMAVLPERPGLFQIGGFAPVLAEDAGVWGVLADEAASRGAVISFDPNIRPALVADPDGYRARLAAFFSRAHIVKLSEEDLFWLDPGRPVEAGAMDLLAAHPRCALVVVTRGKKGACAFGRAGRAEAKAHVPETFGDSVGAGDSLMAGMLAWLGEAGVLAARRLALLDGVALGTMLEFAAVVAGLNCAREGCQPPMRAEVEAALERIRPSPDAPR